MAQRGGRHGSPLSSPARIAAVERHRRVLELRKAGWTFERIAKEVGYASLNGAHTAFQRALKATIQQPADEVRRLEVERLDALLATLWPDLTNAVSFVQRNQAIDRILGVMDRRARMLGLDAPTKVAGPSGGAIDVRHSIGVDKSDGFDFGAFQATFAAVVGGDAGRALAAGEGAPEPMDSPHALHEAGAFPDGADA